MLPTSPPGMDGILASNILFRGSWSSDGQTSPPLSSVVFPCLGQAEPAAPTPAALKTPTMPAVGCSSSVVRWLVFFPASSSTVNTNTQRRPARLLQQHSETSRQLGSSRYTRSKYSCIFRPAFQEVAAASSQTASIVDVVKGTVQNTTVQDIAVSELPPLHHHHYHPPQPQKCAHCQSPSGPL